MLTEILMPERPRVIDLFAGVGGLSLGASRAGFDVVAAVEIDTHAVAAHKLNFPNAQHIDKDITSLSGEDLLREARLDRNELTGLIGGPPCQGFSTIGRRVADDPRNTLFGCFFQMVADLHPAFFVAENVPGILADRNDDIRESALAKIPKHYTVLKPFKVKASDYGAPTSRTRVFFVGYDPQRVNPLTENDFLPNADTETVQVEKALQGLPTLSEIPQTNEGWQSVDEIGSSHFETRLKGHIPPNVGDKRALDKYRESRMVSGFLATTHTPNTITRFKALGHGKTDRISKSVRLDPKGYCPTLRAGTGPEKGSYQAVRPIHPSSPRVICPREAARLQGFPDWFQFNPTKWHAFRQIGNSVSPIVAEEVLSRIMRALAVAPP